MSKWRQVPRYDGDGGRLARPAGRADDGGGGRGARICVYQSLYNNHYITIRLGVAGGLSQATCHPLTESRLFYIYY